MNIISNTTTRTVSVIALVLATGCASIVSGTKEKIKIASTPTDSNITITQFDVNKESPFWTGKTPATVKVDRKKSYLVKITREGYRPAEVSIQYKSMNGWVWGNIVFGGIIGVVIDTADGAAYQLGPDDINVQLVREKIGSLDHQTEADYALLRSVNVQGRVVTHKLLLNWVKQ